MKRVVNKLLGNIESGDNEKKEACEEVLGENLDEASLIPEFYMLPFASVCSILETNCPKNPMTVRTIVEKLYENGFKRIPLLLEHVKLSNPSLEDCINVISAFSSSYLCVRAGKKFKTLNIPNVDEYEAIIEKKDTRIKKLLEKIDGLQSLGSDYETSIEKKDARIKKLLEKIDILQNQDSDYEKRLEKKEARIRKLLEKIDGLQRQSGDWETKIEKKEIEINNLQEKINELQSIGSDWETRIEKKQTEINDLQEKIKELQSQGGDYKTRIEKKVIEINNLQENIAELQYQGCDKDNNKLHNVKSINSFGESNTFFDLQNKPIRVENNFEGNSRYNEYKIFNGVFSKLSALKGNVVDSGVIRVVGSSNNNSHLREVVQHYGCWWSRNEPNSWLQLEIVNKYILIEGYSLSSAGLRSWYLEGSNDEDNWEIIDKQIDYEHFKNGTEGRKFVVNNSEPYKLLRLRQIKTDWGNTHILQVSRIEFFGSVSQ